MIADTTNPYNYPLRTEMSDMKDMLISHVCSIDESKSKYFLLFRNLSQVCFT